MSSVDLEQNQNLSSILENMELDPVEIQGALTYLRFYSKLSDIEFEILYMKVFDNKDGKTWGQIVDKLRSKYIKVREYDEDYFDELYSLGRKEILRLLKSKKIKVSNPNEKLDILVEKLIFSDKNKSTRKWAWVNDHHVPSHNTMYRKWRSILVKLEFDVTFLKLLYSQVIETTKDIKDTPPFTTFLNTLEKPYIYIPFLEEKLELIKATSEKDNHPSPEQIDEYRSNVSSLNKELSSFVSELKDTPKFTKTYNVYTPDSLRKKKDLCVKTQHQVLSKKINSAITV